ncbi:YPTC6 [Symbiodinium sp. CCMP2592]|nr:YPTC6 [Symbiodinium sp. CCMP2592]
MASMESFDNFRYGLLSMAPIGLASQHGWILQGCADAAMFWHSLRLAELNLPPVSLLGWDYAHVRLLPDPEKKDDGVIFVSSDEEAQPPNEATPQIQCCGVATCTFVCWTRAMQPFFAARCEEAAEILGEAQTAGHAYNGGDNYHLHPDGMKPFCDAIADFLKAATVDDNHEQDRDGKLSQSLLPVPVCAKKVVVVCSGAYWNDVTFGEDPSYDFAWYDVDFKVLDVVPSQAMQPFFAARCEEAAEILGEAQTAGHAYNGGDNYHLHPDGMKPLCDAIADFLKAATVHVVLVGDVSVGKTHLLSRYMKDDLPKAPAATIGVGRSRKTVRLTASGVNVKAQIWDTAGQERYRAITRAHYRRAAGAIMVYDVTRSETFRSCASWVQEVREGASQDAVIMLVGNKIDLVEQDPSLRQVYHDVAQEFARQHGLHFVEATRRVVSRGHAFCTISPEASAVSGMNVRDAFEQLLEEAMPGWSSLFGSIPPVRFPSFMQGIVELLIAGVV